MSVLQMAEGALRYELHFSNKRRSIALQVAGGRLTIRAPAGTNVADIKALIVLKQSWIMKHLQLSRTLVKPDWLKARQIPLLDQTLQLQVQLAAVSAVSWSDNTVQVLLSKRIPQNSADVKVRQLLQQWYKQQAQDWFAKRVVLWQQKMGLTSAAIVIGNWKSKWGYCKSTAELGFNWRLMMAPDWVADYVVVHELAHLRHLKHSSGFWLLVQQHYPRHAEAKQWLKQHQHRLEL